MAKTLAGKPELNNRKAAANSQGEDREHKPGAKSALAGRQNKPKPTRLDGIPDRLSPAAKGDNAKTRKKPAGCPRQRAKKAAKRGRRRDCWQTDIAKMDNAQTETAGE